MERIQLNYFFKRLETGRNHQPGNHEALQLPNWGTYCGSHVRVWRLRSPSRGEAQGILREVQVNRRKNLQAVLFVEPVTHLVTSLVRWKTCTEKGEVGRVETQCESSRSKVVSKITSTFHARHSNKAGSYDWVVTVSNNWKRCSLLARFITSPSRGSAVGRCSICGQVFYFNFETEESSWDHPCVRMGNLGGGEGYRKEPHSEVGRVFSARWGMQKSHIFGKILGMVANHQNSWVNGPTNWWLHLQDAHYRALLEEHRKGVGTSKVGGNGLGNGLFWAFLKKNQKTWEAGRIMATI